MGKVATQRLKYGVFNGGILLFFLLLLLCVVDGRKMKMEIRCLSEFFRLVKKRKKKILRSCWIYELFFFVLDSYT